MRIRRRRERTDDDRVRVHVTQKETKQNEEAEERNNKNRKTQIKALARFFHFFCVGGGARFALLLCSPFHTLPRFFLLLRSVVFSSVVLYTHSHTHIHMHK